MSPPPAPPPLAPSLGVCCSFVCEDRNELSQLATPTSIITGSARRGPEQLPSHHSNLLRPGSLGTVLAGSSHAMHATPSASCGGVTLSSGAVMPTVITITSRNDTSEKEAVPGGNSMNFILKEEVTAPVVYIHPSPRETPLMKCCAAISASSSVVAPL